MKRTPRRGGRHRLRSSRAASSWPEWTWGETLSAVLTPSILVAVVTPSGSLLYALSGGTPGSVLAFSLDLQGGLNPVPGSPFAVGDAPTNLALSPSGTFLFVTNSTGSTVSTFSIGGTGVLTPVNGSPFPLPGTGPTSISAGL
ncbi:MAG: beta-propeller fold lactonase family protein [Armatimonadetes bacterium]|nr:beta-propeller fold lactonase family protein [Armatimonadota bacterium]